VHTKQYLTIIPTGNDRSTFGGNPPFKELSFGQLDKYPQRQDEAGMLIKNQNEFFRMENLMLS
jgi:hypothetical protein